MVYVFIPSEAKKMCDVNLKKISLISVQVKHTFLLNVIFFTD